MPRFSLVIPTLQRSDTLRHTLATLVVQTYTDFEIVVQNNGNDPATEAVIKEFNDSRIRQFSSTSTLKLTENWEAALTNARGDFIAFIGDDDGFFPDACELATQILANTNAEIVNWLPYCYYWPNYIEPALRNRLVALIDADVHVQILSSDNHLRRFYRFAIDYSRLPMIYNSFIGRSVVEKAKTAAGRYFLGHAPDVTSGIVNVAHTSQFARISRPLSMTGLSGHSVGRNIWYGRAQPPPERIERDFGTIRTDDRLPFAGNLQIFLANEMLLAHARLSLKDRHIEPDFRGLIESLAATINDRPGAYQKNLAAIHELATRHGVSLDEIAIPAPIENSPTVESGTAVLSDSRKIMVIDGDQAGFANIADAIRWVKPLMPQVQEGCVIEIRPDQASDHAVLGPGERLRFALGGNGLAGLASGWGDPEAWGSWSVAKRAVLRVLLVTKDSLPLHAELKLLPFIAPGHPEIDVVCRARGREIARWNCPSAEWQIRALTISSDLVGSDGIVDLEFLICHPRSPAELGISADTRQLGIGVEWLAVVDANSGNQTLKQ
jgi:hypothetical protein